MRAFDTPRVTHWRVPSLYFERIMRTREEHIKWCKERAIEEMDFYHDPLKGLISMMSDLRKHPETNNEVLISLCGGMIFILKTRQEVINFINGFN